MKKDGYKLLTKAPIIQAILEIKVDLPKSFKVKKFENLQKAIKKDYPTVKNQIQGKFTISASDATSVVDSESSQIGHSYYTKSESRSIMAPTDQFNYFQSEQYGSWKEFKEVALNLWNEYSRVTKPDKIRRVSLRYINRIDIKLPIMDIADHFLTHLEISKKLPQEVEDFNLRYSIPFKEEKVSTHVTQSLAPSENKVVPFLFDIDVLYHDEMEFDNKVIWEKFDELRDIKNMLFFNNLTDSTINQLK